MYSTELKNYIKNSPDLDNDDLDLLVKNCSPRLLFELIDFLGRLKYNYSDRHDIKKSKRYYVDMLIGDCQLDKKLISVKKGPYETGQYSIPETSYLVRTPWRVKDKVAENIPQWVLSRYHIIKIHRGFVNLSTYANPHGEYDKIMFEIEML